MSETQQPLWPQPIPIIGGTGDKWMGKSKFGLNIAPGNRTTLVYDFEQSCTSYEGEYARIGVPFDRVDVQKEMHTKYPKGYKKIDMFVWWRDHIQSVPTGKYRVIMVDPVTDLESGLTDWVSANPASFGHTANQYQSMSGVMWGDVKDYEKMLLADICARCETFYFTAHLGAEFQSKQATGKKKPKGKETLFELSSLYLWFDRTANPKTGERPNVPSAQVIKGRLEVAELVNGDVQSFSVLPPRLPVATPKAIRDYFKNPAGRVGISESETVKEEVMSADDRLRLEVAKAEADRDKAQAVADAERAKQVIRPTLVLSREAADFEARLKASETVDALTAVGTEVRAASEKQVINSAEIEHLKSVFTDARANLNKQSSV